MYWYIKVLSNYVGFQGRASRTEYWMFALVNFIIAIFIILLESALHISFLYFIYILAIFLPSLAVFVRRLHDIGRSGLWIFIGIFPFVGAIVLLVLTCMDSQPEINKYGANPKLNPLV